MNCTTEDTENHGEFYKNPSNLGIATLFQRSAGLSASLRPCWMLDIPLPLHNENGVNWSQ